MMMIMMIPYKAAAVPPLTSHLTNRTKREEQDSWGTDGEGRTNSKLTFPNAPLKMYEPVLIDRQRLKYITSVRTLDAV